MGYNECQFNHSSWCYTISLCLLFITSYSNSLNIRHPTRSSVFWALLCHMRPPVNVVADFKSVDHEVMAELSSISNFFLLVSDLFSDSKMPLMYWWLSCTCPWRGKIWSPAPIPRRWDLVLRIFSLPQYCVKLRDQSHTSKLRCQVQLIIHPMVNNQIILWSRFLFELSQDHLSYDLLLLVIASHGYYKFIAPWDSTQLTSVETPAWVQDQPYQPR